MTIEPSPNPLVVVSSVTAEDDVNEPAGRDVPFEGIEEPDELSMPVALHTAPIRSDVKRAGGG